MQIITLCGSKRFARQMQDIAMELETKRGYSVICPVFTPDTPLDDNDLANLAKAHYAKMDVSDIIYIVNIDGYIGESVAKEIQYAKEHNKKIVFHQE